jgi:hypothetical protein
MKEGIQVRRCSTIQTYKFIYTGQGEAQREREKQGMREKEREGGRRFLVYKKGIQETS